MSSDILKLKNQKGMIEGNLGAIGSMAGTAIGSYFGGPAGGAVGSKIGGAIGGTASGDKAESTLSNLGAGLATDKLNSLMGGSTGGSQPNLGGAGSGGSGAVEGGQATPLASNTPNTVDRWQQNQLNLTAMNQGMKALETNPQLKQNFAPLLSEAMKRAQGGQV